MRTESLHKLFELVLISYGKDPDAFLLKDSGKDKQFELDGTEEALLNIVSSYGADRNIIVIRDALKVEDASVFIQEADYPIAMVLRRDSRVSLYALIPTRDGTKAAFRFNDIVTEVNAEDLIREVVSDTTGKDEVLNIATFLPNDSLLNPDTVDDEEDTRWPLMKRLAKLAAHERREIGFILIYAVIAGLISLSLPLGVQSIVSFVSGGQISTSVIVLIVFIILGLLISGGMQIMQLYLSERIQQRLFSKTAFEFAFKVPRVRLESVLKEYPPELVNRFFDIVTLQKGTATLLLEFSAAILQITFGLLLLSLYHPMFIVLSLFLVLALVVFLRITGPRGLATSLAESKYKYKVANWLEEIARSLATFKLAGDDRLALNKTDYFVSNYLYARGNHFKVLAGQYVGFVLFKTIVTGGLLVAGCLLVVEREINLGQFIASEIVIILIMGAVEKIILKLDTVYDVLTSIDKISHVTGLPVDHKGGVMLPASDKGINIHIRNLSYRFTDRSESTLDGFNLDVASGEKICIAGSNGSGKTSLLNIMLGLLNSWNGTITYDGIPLRNLDKDALLARIGDYVSQESMFEGTLLENLTLGRSDVNIKDVISAVNCVGLTDYVNSLPEGFETKIVSGGMRIPGSVARKVLLARALTGQPRLLLLDDLLLGVERKEKQRIMEHLADSARKWTMIVVSNDPVVMKECERVVLIEAGKVVANGSMEQLSNNPLMKKLMNER
ncbi:MAG: ATP-binding cassette domain-containing protein [Bacteroidia bacterium]|nr:ATP-binding cassette domain-containing protein [Bacteroidia bacterium]